MDDDMEDEIIYEVFTAHAHIIWRYLGVTTAGLVEMVIPGPGESFKNKIFQPWPFMFLMFLVLVASVVLQSSSNIVKQFMVKAHCAIGLTSVGNGGFKSLGDLNLMSPLETENISWDFHEGIAGIYGMQGRRGNMEDRYRVIQDVDVGDKKMSFFGVFDGHGGQYTAEFVKEHLFNNVIEKIKQLRNHNQETEPSTADKRKVSSANSCDANNAPKKSEKRGSLTLEKNLNGISKDHGSKVDVDQSSAKAEKNKNKDGDLSESCNSPSAQKEEASHESSQGGSGVENIKCGATDADSDSMKKDDSYNSISIKKRKDSVVNNAPINGIKEKKEEMVEGSYIDGHKTVNYTKLLTDQIIAVDNQVVEECKGRTDMSGTTAVIAVLDGELLIIGNVGDSRAVMGDIKGSTIPLSFDHKPNQLKERRRIKEAGGFITFTGVWRVAGILATSRALGDFALKEPRKLITAEPDVLTFSLRDHKAHFVILATDGLWDVLTNEEAVAFVRSHIHEADYGAKSLVLHAYYRGSQDNITVAILNIEKLGL